MEILKDIPRYEGHYQASNYGQIRSIKFGKHKPRLQHNTQNFYKNIRLCKKNIFCTFLVHRLIAQTFIPNPENKPCVNHIDLNRINNYASNLEWITHKENTHHAIKNGVNIGSKRKVFQYDKKMNLIAKYDSISQVAKEINVSASSIGGCCKGRRKTAGGYFFEFV